MAKYLEYLRISFINMLAYRARYYVGIITYIIYIAIYYHIWKAIYANSQEIDNFSLPEMTTYVAVGWISRSFFFNNLDRDIEQKVINGSLSMDLLKPMDFQGMMYAKMIGEALFRGVLFAVPTAIAAWLLFPISGPASTLHAAAFLVSTLMAAVIYTNINYIVGALAIPLRKIEGIAYAKQNLLLFFSGLLIPFDMLPAGASSVLKVLPFAAISYQPLSIYLGKFSDSEVLLVLLVQAGWAVALFVASRLFWKRLMQTVIIQGG